MDSLELVLKDRTKLNSICVQAYQKLDADGSGSIDLGEVREMLLNLADSMLIDVPTDSELDELSNFLDPDGDGEMTFKEFHAMVLQFLKYLIQEKKAAR